jgi:hypothetical protein
LIQPNPMSSLTSLIFLVLHRFHQSHHIAQKSDRILMMSKSLSNAVSILNKTKVSQAEF